MLIKHFNLNFYIPEATEWVQKGELAEILWEIVRGVTGSSETQGELFTLAERNPLDKVSKRGVKFSIPDVQVPIFRTLSSLTGQM